MKREPRWFPVMRNRKLNRKVKPDAKRKWTPAKLAPMPIPALFKVRVKPSTTVSPPDKGAELAESEVTGNASVSKETTMGDASSCELWIW